MSEPEGIRFACIGCGALNEAGAETCIGCGHSFAGPLPAALPDPSRPPPAPPPVRRPVPPPNLYEPPAPRVGPPTIRIGTMMAIIAVIAVHLGAFAANTSLGVVASIGLLPASIRLALVVSRRAAEGRPMRVQDQWLSFLLTFLSSYLVAFSAIIAFGLTCFPIGVSGLDIQFAVGPGWWSGWWSGA